MSSRPQTRKHRAARTQRRAHDDLQKLTDRFVAEVDKMLAAKETDLMAI